jgi:hypothetical protein
MSALNPGLTESKYDPLGTVLQAHQQAEHRRARLSGLHAWVVGVYRVPAESDVRNLLGVADESYSN